MEILRAHFDSEIVTSEAVSTGEIFAPENVNGDFGHFEASNPETYTIIGPSSAIEFEGAGTYNQFIEVFYVIDNSGNAYETDPVTGQYTNFPRVIAPAGESFTGLEFDPTTGTGSSTFSEINYEMGEVTVIGNTGLILAIALSFDVLAIPYTYDIDTDLMYRLNKVNAMATVLGPIGFDASFGQRMFLDPVTGLINVTAFNNDTFRSELRTLDTNTGATTLIGSIGSFSPGGTLQFAWASPNKTTLDIIDRFASDFKIFLNPTTQFLEISNSVNIEEIVLINMLGQELLRIQPNQKDTVLDVGFLASDSFVISIRSNDQKSSHKFIKE